MNDYAGELISKGVDDGLLVLYGIGWYGPRLERLPKTKVEALSILIFKLTEEACADRVDVSIDRRGIPMWKARG